jgi:hypothetical protein
VLKNVGETALFDLPKFSAASLFRFRLNRQVSAYEIMFPMLMTLFLANLTASISMFRVLVAFIWFGFCFLEGLGFWRLLKN